MSFYDKYECPVCKKPFNEDDDIVVCPDCGTPHHRVCYDLTGHCVNKGLHQTGYDFVKENEPIVTVEEPKANDNTNAQDSNKQNFNPAFNQVFAMPQSSAYDKDSTTINGESVSDYAATINANAPRFINVFKKMEEKNSKTSWNWGAFFFGSLYYLFRKMYKQGCAFLCLFVTIMFGSSALLSKFAPKCIAAMMDLMSSYSAGESLTNAQMQSAMQTSDASTAIKITYIMMAVMFVLRIIEALFADYFYKGTVANIIKKVKQQLDSGATFSTPAFMDNGISNLNQEQLRKMYLARKGGLSLWAPMLAILLISMII